MSNTHPPPGHLSAESQQWWQRVVADFDLEPWQYRTLQTAAEAFDRGTAARERVDADGQMIESRLGEPKAHPLIAVERDARTAYLRAVRELALDVPPPTSRPPQRGGQR